MNNLAVNIGDTFFGDTTTAQSQSIGGLIKTGLNLSFAVAGIIVLFFFVMAGIKMIQSAGSGNSQDAEKAKQTLTSAAIGFVIIVAAYWIIRLIELMTGSSFITNPTL